MNPPINLGDAHQSGLWIVNPADLGTLNAAAHAHGLLVRRASLLGCRDKRDLLQRIAAAFEFPPTFGHNWDALADCLDDLAWLPTAAGYAWLFDHAGSMHAAPDGDFETLCDILDRACQYWQQRGIACFACIAFAGAVTAQRG